MAHTADIDLTAKDIADLASVDAVASFLTRLGYPTNKRSELTATALGLTGDTPEAIRNMEVLSEDDEQFFRVVFVQLRSLTAKARNEIARNLGRRSADHLLILTRDFETVEFVLIDKQTRQRNVPGGAPGVQIIPRVVTVIRKSSTQLNRRILRRLTWTGRDGLDQFDKLRSVFEAAHYSGTYFQNRALFADHYLENRLRDDAAWRDNPTEAFAKVRDLMRDARSRLHAKDEQIARDGLFDPIWKLLGFSAKVNKAAHQDHLEPDYVLNGPDGSPLTVAFCYRWDRWLDGPDLNDADTPEENPGAAVVSALAENKAKWIIVTNGKFWRLYSKDAHSRSTNFYEVDLEEALVASTETDPNDYFRYWWLFFRPQAFAPAATGDQPTCWLDTIVQGSRDYAKRLGDRLKERIFVEIFPHLAQGFLIDRKKRLGIGKQPTDDELRDTFEATLTLLYRLLFLLYAEARDLLPVREAAYKTASLKQIKEEIAEVASVAESDVPAKLGKAYSDAETTLYDRLARLFGVMDQGDTVLNVPCYNGGLFLTRPADAEAGSYSERERRIARFLIDHKLPDRYLALAIDRLARDVDDKTFGLAFIDYKSLEVRHLGSIYEGLLEFKLKIAGEDLTTTTEKKAEKYIPLSEAKLGRGKKSVAAVVRKGEVYLSNDKSERKASGSYYTPDPIVEYIVEHTVGPVLAEKLDALRPEMNKAGQTYHRHLANARSNPGLVPKGTDARAFAAAKTYAEHKDLVEKVFDLKVLDPAMGSGHFLVEAVDFVTDRLLDFLNRFPNNPVQFALAKTRDSILVALAEQGVTVDSDKLTDINLLKRHVLKRCIYGVDLNPMAVELAKVSLWLDAFTLGAPLSFLDHHLRCGNSLIGATFEDLKKATAGQLFAIDYEPLLRAIRHVLFVNEMADATAAEVHQSADQYASARRELSGYQIVLDLLVADQFVDTRLKPSTLLKQAHDLDLTTRAKLLESLDEKAAMLVEQVDSVARQPDLRFFHWEIEFPEVFFGFVDKEHRRIKHRNELTAGLAGFDAVVGNPPYVDSETMVRVAPEFRAACTALHTVCSGNWDLFCAFVGRGIHLLAHRGMYSQIVPNKLLGAEYAAPLQQLIIRNHFVSVRDYSRIEVFPEAAVYPIVPVIRRADSTDDTIVEIMLGDVETRSTKSAAHSVTSAMLRSLPEGCWSPVLNRDWQALSHMLRGAQSLEEAGFAICGAATVSEAYELKELMEEAPSSRLPRECLRFVNSGTIDAYVFRWGEVPTRYLKSQFERPIIRVDSLKKRFPKRAQQALDTKLIVAGMTKRVEAVLDRGLTCAGKSTTIITHRSEAMLWCLLACLNSAVFNFAFRRLYDALSLQGGYLRIGPPQLSRAPFPRALGDWVKTHGESLDANRVHIPDMPTRPDSVAKAVKILVWSARELMDDGPSSEVAWNAADHAVGYLFGINEADVVAIRAWIAKDDPQGDAI